MAREAPRQVCLAAYVTPTLPASRSQLRDRTVPAMHTPSCPGVRAEVFSTLHTTGELQRFALVSPSRPDGTMPVEDPATSRIQFVRRREASPRNAGGLVVLTAADDHEVCPARRHTRPVRPNPWDSPGPRLKGIPGDSSIRLGAVRMLRFIRAAPFSRPAEARQSPRA